MTNINNNALRQSLDFKNSYIEKNHQKRIRETTKQHLIENITSENDTKTYQNIRDTQRSANRLGRRTYSHYEVDNPHNLYSPRTKNNENTNNFSSEKVNNNSPRREVRRISQRPSDLKYSNREVRYS